MLLGKQLGNYLVEKELGSGAMGSVFRGRDVKSGERVAIKIIAPGLTQNEGALKRFQREIDILKQLHHPNIGRIVRSGKYHGTPLYVMEYLEGESLDKVLTRRGRLTWEEVVTLGQQLCAALQYAHDNGIIHRDLKPSNVMILKDGSIKLTDFGIAKDTDVTALTADNSTVGTASYMSPEQCRGLRDLTLKSDIYSLGVMFYEILTGRKPFYADSILEMFKLHTQGTFERPSRLALEIPIWLDTLVCQMLEKQPEKRPLNAAMVSESLGMVQMKWESQKSAGIDAATKRKIDKVSVEGKLDAEDKDAARLLLGRKKKKKKPLAVYQKGWFTVIALLLLLGAAGFGGWWVFFKKEDPDAMFARLEAQVQAKHVDQAKETIARFLAQHPGDARTAKVRGYQDQIQLDYTEQTMWNRRKKMEAQHERERLAWYALDDEDVGKLTHAAKSWGDLAKNKTSDDLDTRAWGLLGEKYLKEIEAVQKLHADLKERVDAAEDFKKVSAAAGRYELMALEALWAARNGEPAKARLTWDELKTRAADDSEQRRWFLLAAWQHKELK